MSESMHDKASRALDARDLNRKLAEALGWTVSINDTFYAGPGRRKLSMLSTTWDGAGLVVEAMEAKGYSWEAARTFEDEIYFQFTAEPECADGAHDGEARERTFPLATARAALAALEQEEDKCAS